MRGRDTSRPRGGSTQYGRRNMTDELPALGSCICCDGPVSEHAMTCPPCGEPKPFTTFKDRLLKLLRSGEKIKAIKLYREATNCDLREAKEYVESL